MDAKQIHPFEKAGLGLAPFKFVGCEERRGPLIISQEGGVTYSVGAPGQPMGCCDYCFTGISTCCIIRSSDGKEFIVGTDCVRKTGDVVLKQEVNRVANAAKKARAAERIQETIDFLFREDGVSESFRAVLNGLPHPIASMAARGMTLLGWCNWMLQNAGTAGRTKVCRAVERIQKQLENGGTPIAERTEEDEREQRADNVAAAREEERAHGRD